MVHPLESLLTNGRRAWYTNKSTHALDYSNYPKFALALDSTLTWYFGMT